MGLGDQERVWEAKKTEAVSWSRMAGGSLEVSEKMGEPRGVIESC